MRFGAMLVLVFAAMQWLCLGTAVAQPQQFATRQQGGTQAFAYRYTDITGHTRTLQFSLYADDIRRGNAEFQAWNEPQARAAALGAAQRAAQTFDNPKRQVNVSVSGQMLKIQLVGYGNAINPQFGHQVEDTLNTTYESAVEEYAHEHFYLATPQGNGTTSIQPDHPRLAARYAPAMAPVAQAIAQQIPGASQSPRAFINATLSWLQTIPYSELMDRATSNGAGFNTPYGLLLQNQGDCDTKATALAAILRSAYPSLPLAMIYIPDHAFLGIGLPQGSDDFALNTAQGVYVLADATGPRLMPLGQINDKTKARLLAGQTTILPIP